MREWLVSVFEKNSFLVMEHPFKTGANPSNYTPHAIQYIAPVIRSYQGRDILNFPEGTQRTSTQVTGKWRISNTERYSTPQDYNDIEKVTK